MRGFRCAQAARGAGRRAARGHPQRRPGRAPPVPCSRRFPTSPV